MLKDDSEQTCEGCGATIYKEHINTGIARHQNGKLMCPHCVEEAEAESSGGAGFEPIEFDDIDEREESAADLTESRVHGMSESVLGEAGAWDTSQFSRAADPGARVATRCRLFHCKLTTGALAYLNNQINDWIDKDPQITIKFSSSTIGQFEGKHTEPNLIVTLFY